MTEEERIKNNQHMHRLGVKISSGELKSLKAVPAKVSFDYLEGYRDAVKDILKLKGDE